MVILLVFWKIRPDGSYEREFLERWNTLMPISDRSGLIQEFLCKPNSAKSPWASPPGGEAHIPYVTVGLWADEDSLYRQLGGYMPAEGRKESFEAEPRTRGIVSPHSWRRGVVPLDQWDTPWTL